MPDYCIKCQNVSAKNGEGKYVEVTNEEYDIWTEVFICSDCIEQNTLNGY